MENLRTYGNSPFRVAVVHGGPGAIGEMEPVAHQLAAAFGVLEPLQTATTLNGQVEELSTLLTKHGLPPITLIGFSWGAWLSYIVAAAYPGLVQKLILVGSGPYEHHYLRELQQTRMSRLPQAEQEEYNAIIALLNDPSASGKVEIFARLGQLAAKTDDYDPIKIEYSIPKNLASTHMGGNRFHMLLKEAQEMRRDGRLLELANQIEAPVVALHGDYDPHPAEGVRKPLSTRIQNFRIITIPNCGHKPWIERQAKDYFYQLLQNELR